MHVARAPEVKHSLKYLAYLAGKRREAGSGMDVDGVGDEGVGVGDRGKEEEHAEKQGSHREEVREDRGKRQRVRVAPTVSEMMQSAMDVVPL